MYYCHIIALLPLLVPNTVRTELPGLPNLFRTFQRIRNSLRTLAAPEGFPVSTSDMPVCPRPTPDAPYAYTASDFLGWYTTEANDDWNADGPTRISYHGTIIWLDG